MSRESHTLTIALVLCLFLMVSSRHVCAVDAKVTDGYGNAYFVTDIKTYGNFSGVWREEPQCLIDEIVYSVEVEQDKIHKKVLLSDIKEISFRHANSEDPQVIYMQVIKWNEDSIEVDYHSNEVTETSKDGKIKRYKTPESKISPGLIGHIEIDGKQLRWQGFVGEEPISEGKKGKFFIHSSLVKKIVFERPPSQGLPAQSAHPDG